MLLMEQENYLSNILQALKNRYACLISNHGQVSTGSNIANAFELAEEVEKFVSSIFTYNDDW